MGPRHLSRGIRNTRILVTHFKITFNGATAFEPWNRPGIRLHRVAWSRAFNGATAFEPWNLCLVGFHSPWVAIPSMGPRHLSRGIGQTVGGNITLPAAFNGATAFEPWNLHSPSIFCTLTICLQWGHGI